ncbi:MAG: hypothetical protein LLG00_07335 [Planctomycetaceae bacterium]|nr:hypothetical protein [Planctomycetaceae bacterium]
MPVRLSAVVGLVLIAFGCAGQASAELLASGVNSVVRDIKRRQCWPDPFQTADRAAVRAPFCAMVANGWRRQNLLSDLHFQPQTGQLTEAGRLKVQWILTACPEQHRAIYVHIAGTRDETSARLAAVQQWASQFAGDETSPTPPVTITSVSDQGWPAERVDAIGRRMISSTPIPRLPDADAGGASAGGGNAGR